MASEQTFIDRELILPAFVRDLRGFLALPPEALETIAEINSLSELSLGFQQASVLGNRAEMEIEEAASHLRVANHLFHSAVQAGLDAEEATAQLIAAVSLISEPPEIDDERKKALQALFSAGQDETPLVVALALAHGPHYISMDGSWSVKLVRSSDDQVAAVPIVSLNILWHDQSGTRQEAFFQMSEAEWESFREGVEEIGDFREEIGHFLEDRAIPDINDGGVD